MSRRAVLDKQHKCLQRPTGRQIASGRTLAGLSQPELADNANISVSTLKRMEASAGPATGLFNNVKAVKIALEMFGVDFIDDVGVQLRKNDTVLPIHGCR